MGRAILDNSTIYMTDFYYNEIQKFKTELDREKIKLPERYIINENATILFWEDGTKTVVKKCEDDEFNPRLGYLTAFFQHYCGMSKNKANKYLANLNKETKKDKLVKVVDIGKTYDTYKDFVKKKFPEYYKSFKMRCFSTSK